MGMATTINDGSYILVTYGSTVSNQTDNRTVTIEIGGQAFEEPEREPHFDPPPLPDWEVPFAAPMRVSLPRGIALDRRVSIRALRRPHGLEGR